MLLTEDLAGVLIADKSLTKYLAGIFVADKILTEKYDRVLTRMQILFTSTCLGCGTFLTRNAYWKPPYLLRR